MDNGYSNEVKIVLNYALEEAARLGSYIATPDHLFLGILRYRESDAVKILEGLGVDIRKVKKEIEDKIAAPVPIAFGQRGSISLSEKSQEILLACRRMQGEAPIYPRCTADLQPEAQRRSGRGWRQGPGS